MRIYEEYTRFSYKSISRLVETSLNTFSKRNKIVAETTPNKFIRKYEMAGGIGKNHPNRVMREYE